MRWRPPEDRGTGRRSLGMSGRGLSPRGARGFPWSRRVQWDRWQGRRKGCRPAGSWGAMPSGGWFCLYFVSGGDRFAEVGSSGSGRRGQVCFLVCGWAGQDMGQPLRSLQAGFRKAGCPCGVLESDRQRGVDADPTPPCPPKPSPALGRTFQAPAEVGAGPLGSDVGGGVAPSGEEEPLAWVQQHPR